MPQSTAYDIASKYAPAYSSGEDEKERNRRFEQLLKLSGGDKQYAAKELANFESYSPQQFDTAITSMSSVDRTPRSDSNTWQRWNQPTQQPEQQPAAATPYGMYDKATTHRALTAEEDPTQSINFFGAGASFRPGATKSTQEEIAMEARFLSPRIDEFSAMRQTLTQNYERMDPLARSHYNDMQKRVMGLDKALGEGRLHQIEYMRAMDELNNRAKQVKWKYHFLAPGGQVGDMIETDGIRKIRMSNGELQPVSFTPDYIKKNTISLGNGKIAIPISPDKPYEIVEESQWDKDSLAADQDKYEKIFERQWGHAMTTWKKAKELEGEFNTEPSGKELSLIEKRVEAQTLSILDGSRRGAETLAHRRNQRESAIREGRDSALADPMEEEMSRQYKESKAQQDAAVKSHERKNFMMVQAAAVKDRAQKQEQLDKIVQSAGADPDKQANAMAENWELSPKMTEMANNPIVIRSSKDMKNAPDGRVYMLQNKATGKMMRMFKSNGKLFELATKQEEATPEQQYLKQIAGRAQFLTGSGQ